MTIHLPAPHSAACVLHSPEYTRVRALYCTAEQGNRTYYIWTYSHCNDIPFLPSNTYQDTRHVQGTSSLSPPHLHLSSYFQALYSLVIVQAYLNPFISSLYPILTLPYLPRLASNFICHSQIHSLFQHSPSSLSPISIFIFHLIFQPKTQQCYTESNYTLITAYKHGV